MFEIPKGHEERLFNIAYVRSLEKDRHRVKRLTHMISHYLSSGGLFNPELMEHDKVRDLLIEIRDTLA